jgi:hypothetical protein
MMVMCAQYPVPARGSNALLDRRLAGPIRDCQLGHVAVRDLAGEPRVDELADARQQAVMGILAKRAVGRAGPQQVELLVAVVRQLALVAPNDDACEASALEDLGGSDASVRAYVGVD